MSYRQPFTTLVKLRAVVEVTLCLAIVHTACKTFRRFTSLGQEEVALRLNYSLGWMLALAAFGMVWGLRRDFAAYGLDIRRWPEEARATMARWAVRTRTPAWAWWWGLALFAAGCVALRWWRIPNHHTLLVLGWQFFATPPGEEIFFRGYMQSRLNEAFPRRWSVRGVRFGYGLWITALFFGLLHAFNTVDYFEGRWTFAWTLALSTTFSGVMFGLVREAAGSIVPGIILHLAINLYWSTHMPPEAWAWLSRPWG